MFYPWIYEQVEDRQIEEWDDAGTEKPGKNNDNK